MPRSVGGWPACPKCAGHQSEFEEATLVIANTGRALDVLCCKKCKSVVGVIPRIDERELANSIVRMLDGRD